VLRSMNRVKHRERRCAAPARRATQCPAPWVRLCTESASAPLRQGARLSASFHEYGSAPRASKRRSGKARDRDVLLEYFEGAERGRCGCSGVRMPAYPWSGALMRTSVVLRGSPTQPVWMQRRSNASVSMERGTITYSWSTSREGNAAGVDAAAFECQRIYGTRY